MSTNNASVDVLAWIQTATTGLHCLCENSLAAKRGDEVRRAVAELIEAVKVQRGIAEMPGPWKTPDVRQNWARLVGLDQFATREAITAKADANVAAALARVQGGQP